MSGDPVLFGATAREVAEARKTAERAKVRDHYTNPDVDPYWLETTP